ncbi:type II secretion system secretin GspD [Azospirillum canadense]|uniref:type II secretion system secretin GspD n=1 Tax=Azospirillum canadense TaxID=403962 RepID=UPI0022266D9E|nr:type II secretion system secretin GspD [Azospirillum canadense]MCW2239551.1 general secretion pathway protein D [Azospirillum canadense]
MRSKRAWLPLVLAPLLLEGCVAPDRLLARQSEEFQTAGRPPMPLTGDVQGSREGDAIRRETPAPFVRRGPGASTPAPAGGPAAGSAVARLDGGDVTLNFVDADVREVARGVLGDVMGLGYIIDPRVKGTVTLQTGGPLAREAVLPALEQALKMNGATLLQDGAMVQVVPLDGAAREASLRSGATLGGFGTRAVPLRFVTTGDVQKIMQSLSPAGVQIVADEQRNLLFLTGSPDDIRSLGDLVRVLDVDWMRGMSFALQPLQEAEASAVARDLSGMFGTPQSGPNGGMVRFVPIDRLNAVVVIARQPSYLDEALLWVRQFDQPSDAGYALHVYPVRNGRAANLARALGRIFAAETAVTGPAAVAPGLTPSTLSIPSAAASSMGRSQILRSSSTRSSGGTDLSSPAPAVPSPSASSSTAAPSADDLELGDSNATGGQPSGGRSIRVVADESNNALLILARAGEYRMVQAALRRLDVVPVQVLIEATILEVSLNDELRYGLQWFFKSGSSQFRLTPNGNGAVSPAFPGFSYFYSAANIQVALNALQSITGVNVLSSPQLMVLNNQTATLQVGDQVPVPVQSSRSVISPDAPIVNSIEFRDTGVILGVTPRVNTGGLVTLDIVQEVSDVVPTTTSNIDAPTIRQRKLQSSVAVHGGETIALGGLIRDRRSNGTSGLPILSDIPVLGNLFKSNDLTAERTELLVLITPRVVRNRDDARIVTEELEQRMQSIRGLRDTPHPKPR